MSAPYLFLGPAGTFCEAALMQYFERENIPKDTKTIPVRTIRDVFEKMGETGGIGIVPVENVVHGPVTETLDALHAHAKSITIVDTVLLPIVQCIGVKDASVLSKPITRVLSHPQALAQCSGVLNSNKLFTKAELSQTSSTADAACQVAASDPSECLAAIASEWALKSQGLHVSHELCNVGEIKHNKTRFFIIKQSPSDPHPPTGFDGTLISIMPTQDRAGLLLDILQSMSAGGRLNLCAIHSRPDMRGGFRFFIEAEAHASSEILSQAFTELRERLALNDVSIVVHGTYPLRSFNIQTIKTIGIVGGTGKMGGWFRTFFEGHGYKVLASGRRTELTHEMLIEQSDAVIINVPISHTEETIKTLAPLCRPGQLLLDNTSIKTQPVQAMCKYASDGVEVLGMHTVFGPTVGPVRNQNVIFTPTDTSGPLAKEFEGIFYKYNARVTITTPEYHDKQMAFHQNLEHFTKIALARVLSKQFSDIFPVASDTPPAEQPSAVFARYASPNSRASLSTMGRVHCADPSLLQEIQTFNLQGPHMISQFVDVVNELGTMVSSGAFTQVHDTIVGNQESLSETYCKELTASSKIMETAVTAALNNK